MTETGAHAPMTSAYLDNASTTPLDPAVLEAMLPWLREQFGNPSSIHWRGRVAKVAVEDARAAVAALFDADASEILFTSGGTEADNTALQSALASGPSRGRRTALSSAAEHQAVLRPLEAACGRGISLLFAPLLPSGAADADAASDLINDDTACVSLMHANNETGAITQLATIAERAKARGALFHTDAVQSAGKLLLSCRAVPFDFASASAHKLHGPKGIGALYIRGGTAFTPLLLGGSQERGRRAGTESVALIVGFGEAARMALAQREERAARWQSLRGELIEGIRAFCPAAIVNGEGGEVLPSIVSVSFPYTEYALDGEALLMQLDMAGVAVSSGSACTAGNVEPSHVMRAIGHDEATSQATLRFSFGATTGVQEVRVAVDALRRIVGRMRQAGGASRSAMP